ncbi:MAG: Fic family protein [Deltaproteobacteria bacterium]|jgi:hypothetical protein|nr:Fic family protein [Deltaproteobacteria bacterium]
MENYDLPGRREEITSSYPLDDLRRTLKNLYAAEAMSSLAIENIKTDTSGLKKFVGLLENAGRENFREKSCLVGLQNNLVEPRFKESDYKGMQNYVGVTRKSHQEKVRYVCPKPNDIQELMAGLLSANEIMAGLSLPGIVHAAVVSFGFVFLHPFSDGNGRVHRLLIQNVLSLRGEIPEGVIYPVSAAMLNNFSLYEHCMDVFSKPLTDLIDYDIDDRVRLNATGETTGFDNYIDMTVQTEALFHFVKPAVESELAGELEFQEKYKQTRAAVLNIRAMPDRLVEIFIRARLQNDGRLSGRKRKSLFKSLTDDEALAMEKAFHDGLGSRNKQ